MSRAGETAREMITVLKGLGWDHPRCMAPLMASAASIAGEADVRIEWTTRSLKDFGDGDLADAAGQFDLLVFDHPYVGAAAAGEWLVDFAAWLPPCALESLEADALGPCLRSYRVGEQLLGLPIDAAAQVASYRGDLLGRLDLKCPRDRAGILEIAARGRQEGLWIGIPLVPVDAICTFLTLAAALGTPLAFEATEFLGVPSIRLVLDQREELVALAHPASLGWNPIMAYDHMVAHDDLMYVPLAFGYTNYSRSTVPRRINFTDIPAFGSRGCAGSILGGAGIGVSRLRPNIPQAMRYARALASPEYQSGEYTSSGGQPASAAAWRDARCDSVTNAFFSSTRSTLERAYLRPTFNGFIPYFKAAGEHIHGYLSGNATRDATIEWLRVAYARLHAVG
jgi:multiple sugar transport system substrate-binding protein